MDVVKDMLFTEAVVPCALGAIPKLHVGVFCIRFPTDAAFVVITTFFLLVLHCFTKLHRLRPGSSPHLVSFALEVRSKQQESALHPMHD